MHGRPASTQLSVTLTLSSQWRSAREHLGSASARGHISRISHRTLPPAASKLQLLTSPPTRTQSLTMSSCHTQCTRTARSKPTRWECLCLHPPSGCSPTGKLHLACSATRSVLGQCSVSVQTHEVSKRAPGVRDQGETCPCENVGVGERNGASTVQGC